MTAYNLLMAMPDFADPGVWISLLTLTFLEIVLGVDNIIFISIVSNKLPEKQQKLARNIGLLLAMVFRSCLLLAINWIIGLKDPIVTFPFSLNKEEAELALSWKDIILLAGGIFLIIKSTLEIHHKLQRHDEGGSVKKAASSLSGVIIQIILVDAVFSFDSILTAVGLIDDVVLMIIAVVVSIIIMMLFAGPVTRIINKQPTLQMLALSFLVVIGVVLVANGIHQEISKSIIYSCLAFSLAVEALNIRLRKKTKYVELNDSKIENE